MIQGRRGRVRCPESDALPELVPGQRREGHEDEEAVEGRRGYGPEDSDQRSYADDAREQRLEQVRVALLVALVDDLGSKSQGPCERLDFEASHLSQFPLVSVRTVDALESDQ